MSGRYRFGYEPGSLYERLVQLIDRHRQPAGQLVVDLGCGYGAIAEPLRDLGLRYVGVDGDPDAVDDLRRRGFGADSAELGDTSELAATLERLVDGEPLAAVVMADVIEHLTNAEEVLRVVHRQILSAVRHDADAATAPLVVSIPNVSHIDLAAKLLAGRWDVSPTGLLDATHVGFYTPGRLQQVMTGLGWQELERADWELVHSDQHFPEDLAVLAPGSPLHELLHQARSRFAPGVETNQFVRAYRAVPTPAGPTSPHPGKPAGEERAPGRVEGQEPVGEGENRDRAPGRVEGQSPAGAGETRDRAPGGVEGQPPAGADDTRPDAPGVFLSVVVPLRPHAADDPSHDTVLTDALASLAGQSDEDFEVLLVQTGTSGTPARHDRLRLFLDDLPEHLARRTRVLPAPAPSPWQSPAPSPWQSKSHQSQSQSPQSQSPPSQPPSAEQPCRPTVDALATGLAGAGGRWVAMLDGAIAFAHWVEVFHQLAASAPGKVLHAAVAVQRGRSSIWSGAAGPVAGFDPVTWPEPEQLPGVDWLSWLWAPAATDLPAGCGFAVPRQSGFDLAALAGTGTGCRAGTGGGCFAGSCSGRADGDSKAPAGTGTGTPAPAGTGSDMPTPTSADAGSCSDTPTGAGSSGSTDPRASDDPFAVVALRLASLAGAVDTTQVTSVRRRLSPAASPVATPGRGSAGEEHPPPVNGSDPVGSWLRHQWLPVGPSELRRIQATGREVVELRRDVAVHREALAATEAALADARRDLAALRASTSWLVTAPLRMLAHAGRRRARR